MSSLHRFLTTPTYVALFLVAITIFSVSACSDAFDVTPEQHIMRAKDSQDQGNLKAAVIELKNALQQAPDNVEARFLLGQIYVETGDGPAAEKEFRRAVELGLAPEAAAIPLTRALLLQASYQQVIDSPINSPDLPGPVQQAELLALQGDAHLGLGKLDTAKLMYDKALSVNSKSPEAATGKARVAVAQNRFQEAREWLAKVLKTDPDFAPAWSLLGDIEHFEKHLEKAENAYSKAAAHQNNNMLDLLKRANVRIALQNFEGALADIDEVNTKTNRNPHVAYLKGLLNFREQKYDQAQVEFHDALAMNPDHWPTLYYLGVLNYLQGNLEQANQQLGRYANTYPRSDEAAKALALVRLQQANYTGAESVLKSVVKRNPDDELALELLSSAVLQQGKVAENVEYRRHILKQNPQSPQAHMGLAVALLAQGETDQALTELKNATQLDPDFQAAELQVIVTHMNAGEFNDAITAAERLLEKQPDHADALILLGGAYLGKGDVPKARDAFNRALEASPGSYHAAHNLASLELRSGNVDSARRLYIDFLKHQPGHLAALMSLGALDLSQGQTEEAKSWVEQAMQAHPDAPEPRITLATYYLNKGEPNKALALTNELKDKHPDNAGLLVVIGKAQMTADKPEAALSTYRDLVLLQPRSAEARFLLAQAYIRLGNNQHARDELDEALRLEPSNSKTAIAMVRLLIDQGDAEHAGNLLNRLKETDPAHPDVLFQEGRLAALETRFEDAVRAYTKAREQVPGNYELVQNLATAQWQMQDYEGGFETLKTWLKDHPEDGVAQFELANSYLTLNRLPEAKSAFERTVAIWPDNALALNNLAWLIRTENSDKALSYAKRAVELKPDASIFRDTLGEIFLEQGNTKQAIAEFKAASAMAPNNLDIRYHLALALVRDGDNREARIILTEILNYEKPFQNHPQALLLLDSLSKK